MTLSDLAPLAYFHFAIGCLVIADQWRCIGLPRTAGEWLGSAVFVLFWAPVFAWLWWRER